MRAVDTNVLVRIVTQDDLTQLAAAEAFIETGAWVSQLVLAETVWVLETAYHLKPAQIAAGIERLLEHEHLTVQDADIVRIALEQYRERPSLGFSDRLVLEIARKAGHLPLGTFDRTLGLLDGAQRL
jgi:predicted nucleic-acid-binding protein